MSKIGVSNFHYAKMTTEDTATTAAVYENTVTAVPGLVSVNVETTSNTATLYADNGPFETASSLGDVNLTVDLADLPLEVQADLLGHTLSSDGQLDCKSSDVAPYVAVMFEVLLANGKKRAVKLYKGKFAEPNDAANTRGENVEFQTSEATAAFVQLKNNQMYKSSKDFDAGADTSAWYSMA